MKKLLAMLTALASAAVLFTGCGRTDDDSDKKKSSGSSDYKKAVQEMIDALNNKDMDKIMKLSMPDDAADFLCEALGALGFDSMFDEFADNYGEAKLIDIEKTEDIDEEYLTQTTKVYSLFIRISELMEENDLDFEDLAEMDDEEIENTPFAELMDIDLDNLDEIESEFTITDSFFANITIESDNGEESMQVPLYNINGEGWNVDMILFPAMIGYVKKSKQASIDSSANCISKATNAALTDMDEMGYDLGDTCIISSDESLNYNVSGNFDLDNFYETAEEYFNNIDKLDYFIIISGGYCSYAACINSDSDEYVGTYPPKSCPGYFEGDHIPYLETSSIDASEYTLDELYDMAVNAIDDME